LANRIPHGSDDRQSLRIGKHMVAYLTALNAVAVQQLFGEAL